MERLVSWSPFLFNFVALLLGEEEDATPFFFQEEEHGTLLEKAGTHAASRLWACGLVGSRAHEACIGVVDGQPKCTKAAGLWKARGN